jgi:hypothetical protein
MRNNVKVRRAWQQVTMESGQEKGLERQGDERAGRERFDGGAGHSKVPAHEVGFGPVRASSVQKLPLRNRAPRWPALAAHLAATPT